MDHLLRRAGFIPALTTYTAKYIARKTRQFSSQFLGSLSRTKRSIERPFYPFIHCFFLARLFYFSSVRPVSDSHSLKIPRDLFLRRTHCLNFLLRKGRFNLADGDPTAERAVSDPIGREGVVALPSACISLGISDHFP